LKASLFIAKYLETKNVNYCFELVGGMITHILDAISQETTISIVSFHHEQSAAFATDGVGRIKGFPSVALATSGPGATNLITGISSCYFDSTPAVFITGQVNTNELSSNKKGLRQLGFQETDIVSMVKPVVKYAVQVKNVDELPIELEKVFDISISGRQGPCLIDIPMDIQSKKIDQTKALNFLGKKIKNNDKLISKNYKLKKDFNKLILDITKAKKPLLLLGGGCSCASNRKISKDIIEQLEIPVATSLMGLDVIERNNKLNVGFIGSYGNRWANRILAEADFLLVIGSRLDIRQTGSNTNSFVEGKTIWQIDIDEAEIANRVKPDGIIICDIKESLSYFKYFKFELKNNLLFKSNLQKWLEKIKSHKSKYPLLKEYKTTLDEINPLDFIQKLSEKLSSKTIYVTDVGQHQMWSAQSLNIKSEDRFITSGGLGAMGFGLPTAIGAAFSSPDTPIILISGDGSFQLNIQELETLKRNNLNISIILFNNKCHGMVRQFQESYFKNNLQSTVKGYSTPDFGKISRAYDISFIRSSNISYERDINKIVENKNPLLVEVPISQKSKVYPKLAFGRKFGEMEPEFNPTSMEST